MMANDDDADDDNTVDYWTLLPRWRSAFDIKKKTKTLKSQSDK